MKSEDWYVFLPQPVEEDALLPLKQRNIAIVVSHDTKVETVVPLMKKARALILRTGIKITKALLDQSDDLWIISRTGAGVDNVDIEAATERGVLVTSSIGVNTHSVVEHCLALILSLYKRIFLMDSEVRRGNFAIRYKNIPRDLDGKCLGVIGFGRIGSALAEICYKFFNMRILVYDPFITKEIKNTVMSWAAFVTLETLCSESDVVSIHVPLNDETRGLIGKKHLQLMKGYSILINTSRGGIIDEKDLVEALKMRTIGGAGLDVFEKEPPAAANPLLQMDNVILTPHSAALTRECVIKMALSAARRVIDLFDGFVPENIANPGVLALPRWRSLRCKK